MDQSILNHQMTNYVCIKCKLLSYRAVKVKHLFKRISVSRISLFFFSFYSFFGFKKILINTVNDWSTLTLKIKIR